MNTWLRRRTETTKAGLDLAVSPGMGSPKLTIQMSSADGGGRKEGGGCQSMSSAVRTNAASAQ